MQFARAKVLQQISPRVVSSAFREVATPSSKVAAFAEQGFPATSAALRMFAGFSTLRGPSADSPLKSATILTQLHPFETRWSHLCGVRGFTGTGRTAAEFEIKAPFLSDQVPIANGHLGEVEEICFKVGDVVDEGDSVVILETHKASLHIKAEQHDRIKITAVLVEEGQDIYELQPVIKCIPA